MNQSALPYLSCLRKTIANLSAPEAYADRLTPSAVADGLLDYMVVQRTTARELKTRAFADLQALFPELQQAAAEGAVIADLQELKALCLEADVDKFDRCLQLLGNVQPALLVSGTPRALGLARKLVGIEADYCRDFKIAAKAQAEASARERQNKSTARNDRDYDEKALQAFLRQSFSDEPDVTIEKSGFISGGFSKFTIGITLGNVKALPKEIVLRGDASGTFGGASVVDEYHVVKALWDNGVRVARPLALETSGKIFGSPFLLAERLPGTILGHTFNLPTPNMAVCIDVATQIAKTHRVPLAALGPGFGSAHATSSAKALSWVDEAEKSWLPLDMPSAVIKTALEWLRRNAGISDKVPRALVHGDYSLANVLVHENQVSAILDWEFAHVGNPAYDLCYHRYQAEALGSWEAFLEAYGKAGMPIPSEEQLNFNTLLADVRLGVMVCQVKHIFTSGAEPNTATATVLAHLSYETSIERITNTLDKVL